jgi:hypothetical protein
LKGENFNEAFTYLKNFLDIVENYDPNAERISVVHRDGERVIYCHSLRYQRKKKVCVQLSLQNVFKKPDEKPSKSAEEPPLSKSASQCPVQSPAESPSTSPSSDH